ncbi:MAG: DUF86 domain-containing protein [Bacilli bacterium]|nr:DUF86 domain-containing protein [Bacilli bacterium]
MKTAILIFYCTKILLYMKDVNVFEDFLNSTEKVDAVILNLKQIGETAKKLSSDIRSKYTEINRSSIIGLQNMISHEYEGIKLKIIYEIATNNIPFLIDNIKVINEDNK